jgi:prepilin-type N-terminal cleavage/methylation domain-containing protein/prepilin-type processing-associated H-X9-DG protein
MRRHATPTEGNAAVASPGRRASGFTLIELLIAIAIIAIIAAILFPVFAQAREKARQASCESNEKQLALAVLQYTEDYDERLVPITGSSTRWTMIVYPYVKNFAVYSCPDDNGYNDMLAPNSQGDRESYGMNIKLGTELPVSIFTGIKLSDVIWPTDLCMFVEDDLDVVPAEASGYNGTSTRSAIETGYANVWYACAASAGCFTPVVDSEFNAPYTDADFATPYARHSGGANVAFVDGHVKWTGYAALYLPPPGVVPANFRLWHPDAQ